MRYISDIFIKLTVFYFGINIGVKAQASIATNTVLLKNQLIYGIIINIKII